MLSIKLNFRGEKRRCSISTEEGQKFEELTSLAKRLFPSVGNDAGEIFFTYADPEDGACITVRLDEDLCECVKLFQLDETTLCLEVMCEPTVAADPAAIDSSEPASAQHVHTNVTCDGEFLPHIFPM